MIEKLGQRPLGDSLRAQTLSGVQEPTSVLRALSKLGYGSHYAEAAFHSYLRQRDHALRLEAVRAGAAAERERIVSETCRAAAEIGEIADQRWLQRIHELPAIDPAAIVAGLEGEHQ